MEGRGLVLLAEVMVVLVVANGPFTRLKDSESKLEGTIIVNRPAAVLGSGVLELEVAVTLGGRGLAVLAEVTVVLVVANGPFTRLKDSESKLEGTIIVNRPAAVLGGGVLGLEVAVTLGG